MKNNNFSGVITFHTSFSVSQLKSQECTTDVKDTTETRKSLPLSSARSRSTSGCVRADFTDEQPSSGPKLGPKWRRLSHTSPRQLQAKMEAENQQMRKIIKPLLDTENPLLKDLGRFLNQWDVTQLRRKELLHKRWTQHVWFPLQKRVEDRVSSCSLAEAKRRQSLYSQFLHHGNAKGFVFLETYDLKEYNPFLFNINFKLNKDDIKDPLYLQLPERCEQKRIARCEAGCKYTKRHIKKLPQSDRPLIESVMPQANTPLQVSSNYPASDFRKTPAKDEPQGQEFSRYETVPFHIRSTATADGRCHHPSCWFSRCGHQQQPATLQLLRALPTSK